jgi:glycosyl transferase family 87
LSTAVAFVPLAVLPEPVAAAVWAIVLVAGAAMGVALIWSAAGGPRSGLPLLAVIVGCSQPLWLTIINAQFGGLLLGLVGVAAIASRGVKERLGGVALAGLTLKPHVVLLVFLEAVLRAIRERRLVPVALAAAIAGALALAALVVDPAWPRSWGIELLGTRRDMLSRQATAWSLAADIFGDGRLGALLVLGVAAGAIWTLRRVRMSGVERMGLAVCGSLLITPYAGSHDQILLALPWAIILATAIELPPPAGTSLLAALVVCSSLFPWTLYAYALRARPDEATAWLVTAATTLLLAVAIRKRSLASELSSRAESSRTRAHDRSRLEASPGS